MLVTTFAKISNYLPILCHYFVNIWDLLLTTGTKWVDFIKEPYGNVVASFGETQRTDENKEQNRLTTVCKGLRLFCKR